MRFQQLDKTGYTTHIRCLGTTNRIDPLNLLLRDLPTHVSFMCRSRRRRGRSLENLEPQLPMPTPSRPPLIKLNTRNPAFDPFLHSLHFLLRRLRRRPQNKLNNPRVTVLFTEITDRAQRQHLALHDTHAGSQFIRFFHRMRGDEEGATGCSDTEECTPHYAFGGCVHAA
ncbi:Nod factor export ATP-binding protein I [Pyrenophora tritici-repentis]|uniref:Uncharacterized protein n=1 Tax=Pyrenophora tritici-repentis TaxID=45151 RepID=A0A834S377_9PLEO|nr:hypothetical protein PtrM4_063380 [Pyrenophora tritici-repentis]KAI2482789.1 Nod factor export ATP-binding protein I [Pyrenophora tritici-repentis]